MLKEPHRPPPLPQGQTSARTRYITTNTIAAQRLRALGHSIPLDHGMRPRRLEIAFEVWRVPILMACYIRDPQLRDFQLLVKAEVERIGKLACGWGYVVYAIRDPTLQDHHGHPDGPPVYVGQSKQLWIRADDHMKDGGQGTQGGRLKAGRLHRIMKGFVVPKFQIIDDAPTHLTSLIAETAWARRYRRYGYELANQWAEHRTKEAPSGLDGVPTKRLWNLTIADAIKDEFSLVLRCERCGIDQPVQMETLGPDTHLSRLRTLHMKCGGCSRPLLQIERPNPATWKWRSYLPRKVEMDD